MTEGAVHTPGPIPATPSEAERFAVVDEHTFYVQAQATATWAGARMLVAIGLTMYGALVFSYFYLQSLNSNGLWHPAGQQAPPVLGAAILGFGVVGSVVYITATRRLRAGRGRARDWQIAAAVATVLLVVATALQILQLSRLSFFPGASGYSSMFVTTALVVIVTLLLGVYQVEAVFARSIRLGGLLSATDPASGSPEVSGFRLGVDAASLYAGFVVVALVLVYALFYIVA